MVVLLLTLITRAAHEKLIKLNVMFKKKDLSTIENEVSQNQAVDRLKPVCTYHLSRCRPANFSGSLGGNMVGRICVWRLLGTSDQSEYHWPSLVISCRAKCRVQLEHFP